ncbi:MAG: AAA family ATPase [Magnetococcales bacterium]|nr:AAA family ATPase [Magnetococcales bacterium]
MIKSIELEGWKSFSKATLHIDPLTVLIGANASGKSNVLDALFFLQRIGNGIELTEALKGVRGGLEWATMKGMDRFKLSVLMDGTDDNIDFLHSVAIKIQENTCKNWKFSLLSREYSSLKRDTDPVETNIFMVGAPIEYVDNAISIIERFLKNIFILNPVLSSIRNNFFSPLAETLLPDASNIAGVIAALPENKKTELDDAIEKYMRHLPERDIQRIWSEPVGRFKTEAILYCEERWQGGDSTIEMDARGMSDGTLRFLAILTALLTRPSGSLLVIEEVDNGLHPSRTGLLLRMLREIGQTRGVDVLVTTHNPALLDALEPEMIPFVTVAHRDPQTGHSCLTLLEDINRLPKLLAMGSVGRLSASGQLEQALSQRGEHG